MYVNLNRNVFRSVPEFVGLQLVLDVDILGNSQLGCLVIPLSVLQPVEAHRNFWFETFQRFLCLWTSKFKLWNSPMTSVELLLSAGLPVDIILIASLVCVAFDFQFIQSLSSSFPTSSDTKSDRKFLQESQLSFDWVCSFLIKALHATLIVLLWQWIDAFECVLIDFDINNNGV